MVTTVAESELQTVLDDYRIHLTGESDVNSEEQLRSTQNPPDWPTDNYRVPDYRPINRNLDFAERPQGSHNIEFAFLTVMFSGVVLNATAAKLWGATAGPYFPRLFRYAIGGEW